MHGQRVGVVLVAGGGAIGSFLPWIHVPLLGAVNGIEGDGKITLALFAIALLFALFGDRAAPLSIGRRLGVIVSAGLAGVLGIYKLIDLSHMSMGRDDNPFARALEKAVGADVGLYLVAIAGVVAPLIALASTKKRSAAGG